MHLKMIYSLLYGKNRRCFPDIEQLLIKLMKNIAGLNRTIVGFENGIREIINIAKTKSRMTNLCFTFNTILEFVRTRFDYSVLDVQISIARQNRNWESAFDLILFIKAASIL